jgi:hypothetical protein
VGKPLDEAITAGAGRTKPVAAVSSTGWCGAFGRTANGPGTVLAVSAERSTRVVLGLNAVIVAVTNDQPRMLTVGAPPVALPSGTLDPDADRTLERALRRWVREQTGIDLGYVEQLYTLGDRRRRPDPAERLISVAYLALVREGGLPEVTGARWRDLYDFFPWEDFREGRPPGLDSAIGPSLREWSSSGEGMREREARLERMEIMFGRGGSRWDVERSLERDELLYEAGFVPEAGGGAGPGLAGEPMAGDDRRMAAQALGRIRGKLRYRPVVFELLPKTFTLGGLQRVVEALSGVRLHTQNFRRLVARGGLVERTGAVDSSTGGRPAALYRFRREVLRERPAPGVGLPGLRTSG